MSPTAKSGRLRAFSPEKLSRLRGEMKYHELAVRISDRMKIAISPEAIRSWEDGKRVPGSESIALLAAYFGIPIDDLFE